jgi:hypothetical protein
MVLVACGALSVAAASTTAAATWPGNASASPARLTSDVQPLAVSSSNLIREEAAVKAYVIGMANEQMAAAEKRAAAERAVAEAATKKKTAEEAAVKKKKKKPRAVLESGTPEQIAQAMLSQFGWSGDQFSCLQPLWDRESGWSVYAENPDGAYGIPQAFPGSKMATAGPDWQTSAYTQIKWGLEYIQGTYGSPCGAWDHEEADGWY